MRQQKRRAADLRKHLEAAGIDREALYSPSLARSLRKPHGRLRDVDRIATDALKLNSRRRRRIIDRELVVRVFGNQESVPED